MWRAGMPQSNRGRADLGLILHVLGARDMTLRPERKIAMVEKQTRHFAAIMFIDVAERVLLQP
jgi:hypothetical protein